MDDLLDLSWSVPAAAAPSAPPARSTTGTPASTFDLLNARTAPSRASKPSTPAPPATTTATSDAFGDLLSSFSGTNLSNGNVARQTLVERQAQLAREKQEREDQERKAFEGHGAFWDQLGGGAAGATTIKPVVAPKPAHGGSLMDFDDFLAPPARSSPAIKQPISKPSPAPVDPFDFDALTSTSRSSSTKPGMATPASNFDFGDFDERAATSSGAGSSRPQSALGKEQGDVDFLGDLGKPIEHLARSDPVATSVRSRKPPSPVNGQRAVSPPPHILGRIVEMGFSPVQARKALAQTPTGLDVEAALELLLNAPGASRARTPVHEEDDFELAERELQRRREEREQERRRRRRAGPSRDPGRVDARRDEGADGTVTPLQEQADKILAQASEIGASVFTKASSFWSQGKEKVQKAYEEQRKALEAEGVDGARRDRGKTRVQAAPDQRPRWMVQAEENAQGHHSERKVTPGGSAFKDSDDDEPDRPESASASRPSRRGPPAPVRRTASPPAGRSDMSVKERAASLFADEPQAYVSSARRRNPNGRSTLQASPAPQPAPTPVRAKTPPPLRQRQLVPASATQIQNSAVHKATGNEHFKLGRFAEAESSYTTAISALPDGHILLVPLHNNRAAARLKQGNSSSAAEDCTVAITLIGADFHPHRDVPLPAELEKDVKLADALVKACIKRAQAWEMAEKWSNAKEDWEKLMGMDAALLGGSMGATIKLAGEGSRRAKKMLDGPAPAPRPAAVKPKPHAPEAPTASVKSEGVDKMRQAAALLAEENDQRTAIKDSVDAKIASWKGGKETNLRALIASLDTVLWPDVMKSGLKVGMHELITDKQVKMKYMKVIGRLHPDKLNVATDTTVEQKMLANSVFSALSDAWQAFNA